MASERDLLTAVERLTTVVNNLDTTLRNDYPKRVEVERRFTTKKATRARVKVLVATIAGSVIASIFVTTGTISTCFLGGVQHGIYPQICSIMPGYSSATQENDVVRKKFYDMLDQLKVNQKEIDRLKRKVRKLQGR